MKALSGYAEWFWLMAKNWKDVENRQWPLTRYIKLSELPVRIYLHASKTKTPQYEIDDCILDLLTEEQGNEFNKVDWFPYRGALIGEITIVKQVVRKTPMFECVDGFNSPWFFGNYGFVVKDGVLYDNPIPYRGQLGFFEVERMVKDD